MKSTTNYLIITGGHIDDVFAISYVKKEIALALERGETLILLAADSGMEFLKRANICPQIIIGDFDSVQGETLDYFKETENITFVELNPVKDDTDTEFAIRYAIAQGADKITLLGATGSRLDHVLANVYLLGIGLEESVEILLVDEHNRIRMIDKELVIKREEQYGKFFSVIPALGEVTGVTIEGAKYPLSCQTMGGFNSLGVSNEITSQEVKISLETGYLIVLETRD